MGPLLASSRLNDPMDLCFTNTLRLASGLTIILLLFLVGLLAEYRPPMTLLAAALIWLIWVGASVVMVDGGALVVADTGGRAVEFACPTWSVCWT